MLTGDAYSYMYYALRLSSVLSPFCFEAVYCFICGRLRMARYRMICLCRVELVVQVPHEGFDSSVIMPLSWCVVAVTLPVVFVHIQYQASIYTRSLCRGLSWRVLLAKPKTLTSPGHLVSPLVCRGPWLSILVLFCLCHSDGASFLLYFTVFF